MRSKKALLLVTAALSALLMACSSTKPVTHTVDITGFKFVPAELTVNVGDTVEFTNHDMMPHNAVSEGHFNSGKLETGANGKFVVNAKGTFDYICTYHPNMKGRITVQ